MPFANTRFHAVGQGCFYSGEIFCTPNGEPLRLVYDCGSETAGDALEREVDLLHQIIHDAKLDVLVLSHLDADHVNGLTLLLDNGLTARNVFLPYLTPAQRAIAAAGAGDEADPNYFELLADPVGFLEGRGVENIIFVSGGEDEEQGSSDQDTPPLQPSDESGNAPNLGDLKDDEDGKSRYHRGEESKLRPSGGQLSQGKLPLGAPQSEGAEDSRPTQKTTLHFKTDHLPFRLTRCWQGKFFHRDDMRLPVNAITGALDFTIRPGDSTSVQRYKRFLADVHGHFGTLDPGRLVTAIRSESDRKKLRGCYHHIRGNHNDVSLVLWHGPMFMPSRAALVSGPRPQRTSSVAEPPHCCGGTLLTGDLTFKDEVVAKIKRHFDRYLWVTTFLHVPHHGSLRSWNDSLLKLFEGHIMAVVCAGSHNIYNHPHPQVMAALDRQRGRVEKYWCDERNTVGMRIESI